MPRVLDLSRNNCLKVKENKGKKLFFLLFYFSNIWVLGWVNQPSRQQDRDRLFQLGQGQAEGRQTDRQRSAVLLLFQLFAEMSIVFISVYPSYISCMRTFSLRKFEESQDKIV